MTTGLGIWRLQSASIGRESLKFVGLDDQNPKRVDLLKETSR